jgi:hypothetical protein
MKKKIFTIGVTVPVATPMSTKKNSLPIKKVYGLLFLTNAFKSIFKIEIEQTFMFLISALVLDFLPSF